MTQNLREIIRRMEPHTLPLSDEQADQIIERATKAAEGESGDERAYVMALSASRQKRQLA